MNHKWLKNKVGRTQGQLEWLDPNSSATVRWVAWGWVAPHGVARPAPTRPPVVEPVAAEPVTADLDEPPFHRSMRRPTRSKGNE